MRPNSGPRVAAAALLVGAGVLTACSAEQGQDFQGVEELYSAVDDVLECPIFENNIVNIALEDGGFLEGRTCGAGMVVAWSDEPERIEAAREMLAQPSESRPAVEGPGWFVVDAEDSVPPESLEGSEPKQPNSRDLNLLAEELGAEYTEY